MKKVLMSALAYDGGKSGIANYIENVVRALSIDTEIELIVNEDEKCFFENMSTNISFIVVPSFFKTPLLNVVWHMFILPWSIQKEKYTWMLLPAGNRRLMSFYPLKTFVTMHDLSQFHVAKKYDFFRMLYIKKVIPFFLKKVEKVFTVSENTADDLCLFYGMEKEKLIVNYNGVDTQRFTAKKSRETLKSIVPKPYILYVSRIEHPGKNHLNLIKAYEALPELYKSEYDLYLVGSDWNGAEVVHAYAENSLDVHRIKFIGYVCNDDLPRYYANASVFVFPSFYEGFGIPIVEAMASGIPVVSSELSSLPEVGGDAASYFNPFRYEDMERAILDVLTHPEQQKKMARLGLEQVKKFDWTIHAQCIKQTALLAS